MYVCTSSCLLLVKEKSRPVVVAQRMSLKSDGMMIASMVALNDNAETPLPKSPAIVANPFSLFLSLAKIRGRRRIHRCNSNLASLVTKENII